MTMLRKIIDCQSFKSSQKNVQDGVYFSKVASLQCVDCTLFSENVSKSLWRSSVLTGCAPAMHIPYFYQNQS